MKNKHKLMLIACTAVTLCCQSVFAGVSSIEEGEIYENYTGSMGAVKTGSSFDIKKNTFRNNTATASGMYGMLGGGGALYGLSNGVLSIEDSLFEYNKSTGTSSAGGGAILMDSLKSATITNTDFIGNSAALHGGAIYNITGAKPLTITGGKFSGNSAGLQADGSIDDSSFGGAIYSSGNINISEKTVFENNRAARGGAIYMIGGEDPSKFDKVIFKDNYAKYLGGAVALVNGNTQIDNSIFENNISGTRGGAIHINMDRSSNSFMKSLIIQNTDFIGNKSNQDGGAIYVNMESDPSAYRLIRIQSSDGETHHFTGNVQNFESEYLAEESNAIYINQGTVELSTINEGSKLVVNDGIAGGFSDKANLITNGDITLNGQIKNLNLTHKAGTLQLNKGDYLAEGKAITDNINFTLESGTLDMANDKLDVLNINDFESGSDAKIIFDADLALGQSDFFNIKQEMNGSLTFDAEHIDVKIKNGDADKFQLFSRVGEGFEWINKDNKLIQYNEDTKFTMTVGEDGYINVKKDLSNGLTDAIAAEGERTFMATKDITLTEPLGAMGGDYLKLNLDRHNMNGNEKSGLIVAEGQKLELNNAASVNNFVGENGSVVDNNGELVINNSVFKNNSATGNGGVINNNGGDVKISDSSFVDNNAGTNGGAININGGSVTVAANNKDVIFLNNKAGDAANDIYMNSSADSPASLIFTGGKNTKLNGGIKGNGVITKNGAGTLTLGGDNSEFTGDVNYNGGQTHFTADSKYFSAANTNFANGGMLNLANNSTNDHINFGALNIDATGGKLGIDINMKDKTNDTIAADSVSGEGNLVIDKVNVIADGKFADKTSMSFDIIEKDADGNSPLFDRVMLNSNSGSHAYGAIFKYGVDYNSSTGQMMLSGGPGKTSASYNPAVLASPIGALVGAYLTQLNSYDMAFTNMDMYMLMPKAQREAMKLRNRFASTTEGIYSPTLNPHEERGVWMKPYSTFESVRLKNGPRVSNVAYGSFFGVDSDMQELGHGFDGILSLYAGYNGSHQAYQGNSIYQNGGQLGLTGIVYKGNFFSALTANVGANVGEASTMYGNENFTMLMTGVASKTGYNWEFADGKFIFQPSWLMSYSFINTFDYHNAANVSINADPLNVLQLSPGVKFMFNTKNGWQPYLGCSIIWNLMNETQFTANDFALPELSVKPYFSYGLGLQKTAGERFTGFFQTMFRSGGRNGVGFLFGFRMKM